MYDFFKLLLNQSASILLMIFASTQSRYQSLVLAIMTSSGLGNTVSTETVLWSNLRKTAISSSLSVWQSSRAVNFNELPA